MFGDNLFVVNEFSGTISEYTTSGALVNPALIRGLNFPFAIAVGSGSGVVADGPSTCMLLLLALAAMFGLNPVLRRPV